MPAWPIINAPVGKSGPGRIVIKSSILISGLSTYEIHASITSAGLCGGMFVAMPTAMPPAPFTNKLGYSAGNTCGSSWLSS